MLDIPKASGGFLVEPSPPTSLFNSARPKQGNPVQLKPCITSITFTCHNTAETEKELKPPSTAPSNEKKPGIQALLAALPASIAQ